jgi:glycosyltransferase involved in cell wall biosynthesis
VCEAMACSRPVVAYAGGSIPEVMGDVGWLVPVGDLAGLTGAVQQLIASPERRLRVGKLGRERVERMFNPSQSLHTLNAIYEGLLSQ